MSHLQFFEVLETIQVNKITSDGEWFKFDIISRAVKCDVCDEFTTLIEHYANQDVGVSSCYRCSTQGPM